MKRKDVEKLTVRGQEVERFTLVLDDGEEWPVSINHTRGAVKVQNTIYTREAWAYLCALTPARARQTHRVCEAMDGEIITDRELRAELVKGRA